MKKLLVANWKMNPPTFREAETLARASDRKNVVICPPSIYVSSVMRQVKRASVGAQDVFWDEKGAHTGEISPRMIKKLGVQYVILGHSERRALGETDETINKKVKAALSAGLKVILCIGEPLTMRRKGISSAKRFVKTQLAESLKSLNSQFSILDSRLLITYEPIWAISTAKGARPDNPEDAAEMIRYIKNLLRKTSNIKNPTVIYGGSVTKKNAVNILHHKDIDGALVGGASLRPEEFRNIIKVGNE